MKKTIKKLKQMLKQGLIDETMLEEFLNTKGGGEIEITEDDEEIEEQEAETPIPEETKTPAEETADEDHAEKPIEETSEEVEEEPKEELPEEEPAEEEKGAEEIQVLSKRCEELEAALKGLEARLEADEEIIKSFRSIEEPQEAGIVPAPTMGGATTQGDFMDSIISQITKRR